MSRVARVAQAGARTVGNAQRSSGVGGRPAEEGEDRGRRGSELFRPPPYPENQTYISTRYHGSYADVFRHTVMTHLLARVNESPRGWTFYDMYSGAPHHNIKRTSSSHIYREPRMRGIDRVVEWARDNKPGQPPTQKLKKTTVFDGLLDNIRTLNATKKHLHYTVQSELDANQRRDTGFEDIDEKRYLTSFGLRSRLVNNFEKYPGNMNIVKQYMRKQDRAMFLESSSTEFVELERERAASLLHTNMTVWQRLPTDGVFVPQESPIPTRTNSIVDVLAGAVNTCQPIVWVDLGEHVDLKQVLNMPNTTTRESRHATNMEALRQRGVELWETLDETQITSLIGRKTADDMTTMDREVEKFKANMENKNYDPKEDWDMMVDMRDEEDKTRQEEYESNMINKTRKIRAGQVYIQQMKKSQLCVNAPGWNKANQGFPYNKWQHDRNWMATEYARKFLYHNPLSIIAITYPIYNHTRPINLYRDLLRTGVQSAITADFMFESYRPELDGEYSGIGIVIANPPESFELVLNKICHAMEQVVQKRHLPGELDETKKGTHIRVPRVAWISQVQNGDVEVSDAQLSWREPLEELSANATNIELRRTLNLPVDENQIHNKHKHKRGDMKRAEDGITPPSDVSRGVKKTILVREFVQRLHLQDESQAKRKQEAFFNDLTSFVTNQQQQTQVPGQIIHTPATTSLSVTQQATSTSSSPSDTVSVSSTSSTSSTSTSDSNASPI